MIPLVENGSVYDVSKPRASGDDPGPSPISRPLSRVNPARAGMILGDVTNLPVIPRKPRASGDDPSADSRCEMRIA